jgi:hypothetical protein
MKQALLCFDTQGAAAASRVPRGRTNRNPDGEVIAPRRVGREAYMFWLRLRTPSGALPSGRRL